MELGVSYVSAHNPDHIDTDMRRLADIGCTEVLFALQENHIVHLNGALRYGAEIAKSHGLRPYVVVWGFANTFGGGQMSTIMLGDTSLWRVNAEGEKYAKGCLNNPRLVDKFVEITDTCRAHGFLGMFVDEPSPQQCYCDICRNLYAKHFGGDLLVSRGTPNYKAFQISAVKGYTGLLCKKVKALDSNQRTICCVMPIDMDCFEAVAAIPELDVFGTDPYWLLPGHKMNIDWAVDCARLTKDICDSNGKISQVWLNCWSILSGREEEIYTGGKALAEVGCDSMYTWSFRGALGTSEECERPDLAWASVEKLYGELSGRG